MCDGSVRPSLLWHHCVCSYSEIPDMLGLAGFAKCCFIIPPPFFALNCGNFGKLCQEVRLEHDVHCERHVSSLTKMSDSPRKQ